MPPSSHSYCEDQIMHTNMKLFYIGVEVFMTYFAKGVVNVRIEGIKDLIMFGLITGLV